MKTSPNNGMMRGKDRDRLMKFRKAVIGMALAASLTASLALGGCGGKDVSQGSGSSAVSGGTSTSGSEDVSGTNSQNTASGTQSNSSGGGSSQTGPTAPADGKRIPAAYGTADWKPFGTAAIYSAKAQNTHINNLTPASIESKNGRSHMLVNGKEVAPVSYFGSLMGRYPELTYETYEKMQKVGANYIYVDVHINVSNPNVRYASIKTQLEDVLYAYPDAYLFVRYTPWASASFYGLPASEDLVFADGSKFGACSIASDGWIEQAVTMTREMIAYLSQDKELASRIIGYIPLVNNSGEWFSQGYWEGMADVSEANTRKFREWLKYRYNNDVSALRKAWGDNSITFDTVKVPVNVPGLGPNNDTEHLFLLEEEDRIYVDYCLYYCDLTCDRIEQLARAVKLETGGKSLFTSFYGYHCELFGAVSGHYNLTRMLQCEDVDILAGPVGYSEREATGGIASYMTIVSSVAEAGKMWFDESDYRTYLSKDEETGFSPFQNLDELIRGTQKEMAKMMVFGTGTWWADIGSQGWFNDQTFWDEVAELSDLYMKYNQVADNAAVDVAFIVDEAGMALDGAHRTVDINLIRESRGPIYKSGLNFGYYLLDDLLDGKVDAKMLVMLSCNSLTDSQLQTLKKQVQQDGRTVLWMNGFGELSAAQVKELTGFQYSLVEKTGSDTLTMPANSSLNFPGCTSFGARLYDVYTKIATGSGVTVLGTLSGGDPGLSAVKVGQSTQLFYVGYNLTSELLRAVAGMGGVPVYAAGNDTYYGNGSLSFINAGTAGNKTLTLPQKSDVYCYYTRKWYTGVTSVTLNMKAGQNELFFIGSQSALQAAGIG